MRSRFARDLRRVGRDRPVLERLVGRVPGPVRRGDVHRQGAVRRGRLRRDGRPGVPGQPHPQPRPDRVELRPVRAGHRRRGVRRLPGQVPRLRPARAPLGPRRLAAPAVARPHGADAGGPDGRTRSTPLGRWKVLDNLRRSLRAAGAGRCCSRSAGRSCPARRGRGRSPPCVVLALPLVPATARQPARPVRRGSARGRPAAVAA